MWFGSKALTKVRHLESDLGEAFDAVKNDLSLLYRWVQYLYEENQKLHNQVNRHESILIELNTTIRNQPKTNEQIKGIIDYYYDNEKLINKIEELEIKIVENNKKIGEFEQIMEKKEHKEQKIEDARVIIEEIQNIRQKIEELEHPKHTKEISRSEYGPQEPAPTVMPESKPVRKPILREKLIKKITQRSKDYVKNILLSYIKKYGRISAMRLREMVVEEQGLTSRSSFYRILGELEVLDEIGVVQQHKEKFYFFKPLTVSH